MPHLPPPILSKSFTENYIFPEREKQRPLYLLSLSNCRFSKTRVEDLINLGKALQLGGEDSEEVKEDSGFDRGELAMMDLSQNDFDREEVMEIVQGLGYLEFVFFLKNTVDLDGLTGQNLIY